MRAGWLGTVVSTQHDDFDDVDGQGAIPIIHDQNITLTEARLSLDVGLTKRFGASVAMPFRVVSTSIRYLDGRGDQVDLVQPSTHHRNETLSGIGDPMVLGSYARSGLTLRAGASLPLGRTEANPFANPELPHEHIQMGTGTINPVVSLDYAKGWGRWRASIFGFTQQIVYANSKGYQAGDRYAFGVGVRQMIGKTWSVRTGLEMQAETYERWAGVRHTDEGNQGRIDAMLALGAAFSLSDSLSLDVALKLPFITHVVGGQLAMPALLEIGVSYAFAKPRVHRHDHDEEDDHDHEHEGVAHHHDDEHGDHEVDSDAAEPTAPASDVVAEPRDTTPSDSVPVETPPSPGDNKPAPQAKTPPDIADIGHEGARVDLIPVPGKITIFDFWAPWCVPCKTLEPVITQIAKANPAGVAVRRIDVVDWDSQVVAQYLTPKAFNLPYVRIYDATGKLVYEDSSAPGKLQGMVADIRKKTGFKAPRVATTALSTRVDIIVTERGFEPADITVPRGKPVTLRILRKVDKSCATEIVFDNAGDEVHAALPLDQEVELTVTFKNAGVINFTCDMKMLGGTITVR